MNPVKNVHNDIFVENGPMDQMDKKLEQPGPHKP